jgi:hypothetical protein
MLVSKLIKQLTYVYDSVVDEVYILVRNELSGEYTVHKIVAVGYTRINNEKFLTINAETEATAAAFEVEDL